MYRNIGEGRRERDGYRDVCNQTRAGGWSRVGVPSHVAAVQVLRTWVHDEARPDGTYNIIIVACWMHAPCSGVAGAL